MPTEIHRSVYWWIGVVMAETTCFQWQNEASPDPVHFWGKMRLYGFPVCHNKKVDLLAQSGRQILNRVQSNGSKK